MREVRTGVWHWQAPHPEPGADGLDWPEKRVSSYALDDGERPAGRAALERALA